MRKRVTTAVVLAALLVAVLATGATWVRAREAFGAYELRLAEVHGDVTLQRDDARRAVEAPQALLPADRIATAADGGAVLSVNGRSGGPPTEIRVGPFSALQVTDVDRTGVSLELEDGALEATVRPNSAAVNVANRGRAVSATDGTFAVGVQDDLLKVHVRTGEVELTGADVSAVRAGEAVTVIERGGQVAPLPEELLFGIVWPSLARTREGTVEITGRTEPGATITFRGGFDPVVARADAEGRFRTLLPLVEGENGWVDVVVTDWAGRTRRDRGRLPIRDTTGPQFTGDVDYGGR